MLQDQRAVFTEAVASVEAVQLREKRDRAILASRCGFCTIRLVQEHCDCTPKHCRPTEVFH
eukprot:5643361-Amphidinium_carterae.1